MNESPDIERIENTIDGMCMEGLIMPEAPEMPNGWVLIVDIADEIYLFMDRHSKSHATMGLCEYAREMIRSQDFDEVGEL